MGELGCILGVIYLCIFAYAISYYPLIALIMIVVPIAIYIYQKYYSEEGKERQRRKRLYKEKRNNQRDLTRVLIKFITENGGIKKFEAYSSEGFVENMKLTNMAGNQVIFSLNGHGYSKTDIYTIYNVFNKLSVIFNGKIVRKYEEHRITGVRASAYAMYGDSSGTLTGVILYSKKEYKRLEKEKEDKRDMERYGDYKKL